MLWRFKAMKLNFTGNPTAPKEVEMTTQIKIADPYLTALLTPKLQSLKQLQEINHSIIVDSVLETERLNKRIAVLKQSGNVLTERDSADMQAFGLMLQQLDLEMAQRRVSESAIRCKIDRIQQILNADLNEILILVIPITVTQLDLLSLKNQLSMNLQPTGFSIRKIVLEELYQAVEACYHCLMENKMLADVEIAFHIDEIEHFNDYASPLLKSFKSAANMAKKKMFSAF